MRDRPTYIVTGGGGFIGSNIVAALLSLEPRPRVVVVDTFRTGSFANIIAACDRRGSGPFDGEVMPDSTRDIDWPALLQNANCSAVIHQAAITDTTLADQREMIRENAGGFAGLLRACAEYDVPLAYASSAAVYGTPPQARDRAPFPVEAAGRPENVYGFSKWLMELDHARVAAEKSFPLARTVRVVGLRYFNVFGPGEAGKGRMASMIHQLAVQMIAGRRPRVFHDGTQARDQVFVDDVVDCTLAAAGVPGFGGGRPRPGVYNVGSGVATSFNDIIAVIRRALGLSEGERPTDYFEMPADVRAFYQDFTCADLSATQEGLGWQPRHAPSDAIEAYVRRLRGAMGRAPRR